MDQSDRNVSRTVPIAGLLLWLRGRVIQMGTAETESGNFKDPSGALRSRNGHEQGQPSRDRDRDKLSEKRFMWRTRSRRTIPGAMNGRS